MLPAARKACEPQQKEKTGFLNRKYIPHMLFSLKDQLVFIIEQALKCKVYFYTVFFYVLWFPATATVKSTG